jgi:peptidoglycan hydrolase-like protein with peptidoglycan-binding domain
MKTFLLFFLTGVALVFPLGVQGAFVGETVSFSIDSERDLLQRKEISATLVKIGPEAYYYMESTVWNALSQVQQSDIAVALEDLDQEFHYVIYPTLRDFFGQEWTPGIDNDPRITVLLHRMKGENGGYVNVADQYEKVRSPMSNQREMVYLNTERLGTSFMKSFLAHEFVHLITFNQKERLRGVSEDVWLNELRAEYASTLVGYDTPYQGSNLKRRVQNFSEKPNDSLTEWQNTLADYGSVGLFGQYIADQYGAKILVDSLHSSKTGISSLEEALASAGFTDTFGNVFVNWVVALVLNDCQYGERYCYHNPSLKSIRLIPQTNFLPSVGESTLALNNTTKDWAGNWIRVVGGKNVLSVEFQSSAAVTFRVPYLLEGKDGIFSIRTLEVSAQNRGAVTLPNFSDEKRSAIFMPVAQGSIVARQGVFPVYPYSLVISASEQTQEQKEDLISKLLSQIESLQQEIARLQAQLALQEGSAGGGTCKSFSANLFFGMRSNSEVRCLQEFLKSLGPEIYPEGIISGNFLTLTRQAVIRFQEKYAVEILTPLGLLQGTGYVGGATRAKLNSLLQDAF